MSSTKQLIAVPTISLNEHLRSRLKQSKELLFSFIWILLLLLHFHLSLVGLSIPSIFYADLREYPFLNITINIAAILSTLLFFHNHPSFLKNLSNRTKLVQIFLSVITIVSAFVIIYSALLQFSFFFEAVWFADLWLFLTLFSMIVSCPIVFIAFMKKYLKSLIPHAMILIVAESREIINLLRDTGVLDKTAKKKTQRT